MFTWDFGHCAKVCNQIFVGPPNPDSPVLVGMRFVGFISVHRHHGWIVFQAPVIWTKCQKNYDNIKQASMIKHLPIYLSISGPYEHLHRSIGGVDTNHQLSVSWSEVSKVSQRREWSSHGSSLKNSSCNSS